MRIFTDTDPSSKSLERHTITPNSTHKDDSFLIILILLLFLFELKDNNHKKT